MIPFLVWFIRFSGQTTKRRPPRVKELIDERLGLAGAILGPLAVCIWATGIATRSSSLLYSGSSLLLFAVLSAAFQLKTLTRKEYTNESLTRGSLRAPQSGY